jgi:serine/threonine protein kinase
MMFDEYRVEQALGTGGMAAVYRAIDVKLKRYVALKVIASQHRERTDYTQRFEREAQSIASLHFPNIVQIYRFGEANGMFYIAMQYIDGTNLGKLIADYKAAGEIMPLGDVVRVVQDIGAALDYAHSRSVIHRDVKPTNIMVDSRGQALLTDFGLASVGDVETKGEILGSPFYVAPEQVASSSNAIPQSDIYSLGVTLFEMLTGELPFKGNSALEVSMRHTSDLPPPPSQFNAVLSPEIDAVVLRALEKQPYDRYATGTELSIALEEAVAAWRATENVKSERVRRPSLVMLSHKVNEQLKASALASPDDYAASTRIASPNEIPTVEADRQAKSLQVAPRLTADSYKSPWVRALAFALVIFLVGFAVIFVLRSRTELTQTPNQTSIISLITEEPTMTFTATSTVIRTSTLLPTLDTSFPTPVPIVINTMPAAFPTPVPILMNTLPANIVPTAMPPDPNATYQLLIVRRGQDSLFVVNVGAVPVPLAGLVLSGERERGSIEGSEWGVELLQPGQCVTAWKSNGNPRPPDIACQQVGNQIMRDNRSRFWRSRFDVFYNNQQLTQCDRDSCSAQTTP